jgi:serine/threonine protein kinase
MAAPATAAEFLDVVRKSGLVAADQIAPATPETPVDQLASRFIRDGLLSKFQAKQLRAGRYRRFEVAGKYRLLELLGVGGMGAVYLCEHTLMRRLVAVKVLPADKLKDPSTLERFHREARAVAALDDPNIVRAYDIDKYEGLHFLVMEYVDGASLQELVARHGPLDPLRAAHYVAQSALGLQHAHELGMVHRDIKPGNLLLDRTGTVKILDMGLARFFGQTNDNVTERYDPDSVLGTADYLAPEQALSNVVDIRADLYALGGSLYFLLTGSSPFPKGTVAEKLVAHQTKEPTPVTAFRKDVPAELLAVLAKLMKKDPAERYQTPTELVAALAPWTSYPIGPPPAHEMPDLCPLVLAKSGHAADKPRLAASRLAAVAASRSGVLVGRRPADPEDTPAAAQMPTGRPQDTAPLPPRGVERPGESAVELLAPLPTGTTSEIAIPAPSRSRRADLAAGFAAGFATAAALAGLLWAFTRGG